MLDDDSTKDSFIESENRQISKVIQVESEVDLKLKGISDDAAASDVSATIHTSGIEPSMIKRKTLRPSSTVPMQLKRSSSQRVSVISSTPKISVPLKKRQTKFFPEHLSSSFPPESFENTDQENHINQIVEKDLNNVTDEGYITMTPNTSSSITPNTSKIPVSAREYCGSPVSRQPLGPHNNFPEPVIANGERSVTDNNFRTTTSRETLQLQNLNGNPISRQPLAPHNNLSESVIAAGGSSVTNDNYLTTTPREKLQLQNPNYISRRNGQKYCPTSRAKRINAAIEMREVGPIGLFSEVDGQVFSTLFFDDIRKHKKDVIFSDISWRSLR